VITYIIQRLFIFFPMLLVISFLVYLGLELAPGDAVSHMISPELASTITAEQLNAMREAYGLNQSFLKRYWLWLISMIQGDMGYSMAGGVAISEIMAKTIPATLELSIVALIFSTIIGCSLGVISALKRGSGTDNSLTVAGMAGVSIPEFFFGLVAILLFAIELRWLPVGGRLLPHYETVWDRIPNIVLPSMVLALMMTAGAMRYARSSMLDVLAREFITTARSKGMPEWRINILHGFRVALTPVVVLIGFRLPLLIGGSTIIEQVYQWPGIGSMFIRSVRASDYPLVMTISLMYVFVVLTASLIIDVLTALIDPRVRLGKE